MEMISFVLIQMEMPLCTAFLAETNFTRSGRRFKKALGAADN